MSLEIIDLLNLAQYALAAAHAKVNNRLSPEVESQFFEWTKANKFTARALQEFPASAAARAARLAFGMLVKPQLARDTATTECTALLQESDILKELLADAQWEGAADIISRDVIDAYHAALLAVTEVQR